MSIDLSQDWKLLEHPQTLSLSSRTAEDAYADAVEVPNCNRMAVDTLAAPSDLGDFEIRQTYFDLWASQLGEGTPAPKMGDRIEDAAGTLWDVLEARHCDKDAAGVQRYHCLCQRSD